MNLSDKKSYLQGEHGELFIEIPEAATVVELIDWLGLPQNKIGNVLVNKKGAFKSECLSEGDFVILFPFVAGG